MLITAKILFLLFLCTTSANADESEETTTVESTDPIKSEEELSKETAESDNLQDPLQPPSNCGFRNTTGGFPWLVEIYSQTSAPEQPKSLQCGGILIAPNVVATSAHCVHQFKALNLTIEAKIGTGDAIESRTVKKMFMLDHFELNYHMNAMAILILGDSFDFKEHIQPICLPPNTNNFEQKSCILAYQDLKNAGSLQTVDFEIISSKECSAKLLLLSDKEAELPLHESIICASATADVDNCEKMLGYPLMCPVTGHENRYYLAGIATFHKICSDKANVNQFVNVALFRRWIEYHLKKEDIDSHHFAF